MTGARPAVALRYVSRAPVSLETRNELVLVSMRCLRRQVRVDGGPGSDGVAVRG